MTLSEDIPVTRIKNLSLTRIENPLVIRTEDLPVTPAEDLLVTWTGNPPMTRTEDLPVTAGEPLSLCPVELPRPPQLPLPYPPSD